MFKCTFKILHKINTIESAMTDSEFLAALLLVRDTPRQRVQY